MTASCANAPRFPYNTAVMRELQVKILIKYSPFNKSLRHGLKDWVIFVDFRN